MDNWPWKAYIHFATASILAHKTYASPFLIFLLSTYLLLFTNEFSLDAPTISIISETKSLSQHIRQNVSTSSMFPEYEKSSISNTTLLWQEQFALHRDLPSSQF